MKSKSSLTVAQHKSLGLYEALIECDRVIIRSNSLDELFGEVCRHVVHFGDMCGLDWHDGRE